MQSFTASSSSVLVHVRLVDVPWAPSLVKFTLIRVPAPEIGGGAWAATMINSPGVDVFVERLIPLLNVPAFETGEACSPITAGSKVKRRSKPVIDSPVVFPIAIGKVKLVTF